MRGARTHRTLLWRVGIRGGERSRRYQRLGRQMAYYAEHPDVYREVYDRLLARLDMEAAGAPFGGETGE